MIDRFINWLNTKEEVIQNMGIKLDRIIDARNEGDGSYTVSHVSVHCIGQIIAWDKRFIDLEVLELKNGDRILYIHCEYKKDIDLDALFDNYFKAMIRGQ